MKIEALTSEKVESFIAYCKKHKAEIDDSFLYDEDLKAFKPDAENPTYLITNSLGEVIAAASLMITEYYKRGRSARFRIFHAEPSDDDCYSMLMQAVIQHTKGLDKVFLFVPMNHQTLRAHMERLGFEVERYSFLFVRESPEVPEYDLQKEYEIRAFRAGMDEGIWCDVRNAGFARLQGNDTPITPEMVTKMMQSEEHIEGGMMILFHHDRPVGIVRGAADEYEGEPIMNIGPLAILPEYQGRGLGRILLRAALRFAKEKSYARTILSVNGENERAKTLYLQEGFRQVEAVACYAYRLK